MFTFTNPMHLIGDDVFVPPLQYRWTQTKKGAQTYHLFRSLSSPQRGSSDRIAAAWVYLLAHVVRYVTDKIRFLGC